MKLRFSDSKWTEGKLKFFLSLCEKLKHDMGEFAEILAPSRKGFQQIIIDQKPQFIFYIVHVIEGLKIIEKVNINVSFKM